jgi:hypothetical protein
MAEPSTPIYGLKRSRGVDAGDVERAADALLRAGDRPTIEKIRAKIGAGSPNTINPLLDSWWSRLGARLDAGPAALHRLPESVLHVAEALWMQALEEGRARARRELKTREQATEEQRQAFEVRSHVLTLREGEMQSQLQDRQRALAELESQVRYLTLTLRKDQASLAAALQRVATLESQVAPARKRLLGKTRAGRRLKGKSPTRAAKRSAIKRKRKSPARGKRR